MQGAFYGALHERLIFVPFAGPVDLVYGLRIYFVSVRKDLERQN